tara:strand:+ start:294 stop:1208 length:915 start_codon:yes stop_codon:yes gene_type:complete
MKKNAIYTIIVGQADRYAHYCMPSIRAYAEATDSELYVFTEEHMTPEYPTPHFLMFELMKHFGESEHERMLYIDADIIVHKGTPDIFKTFESGFYMREGHTWDKLSKWTKESLNIDTDGARDKYFSSGALLADKDDVVKFNSFVKPPFVVGPWHGEMAHFNYFLLQSGIDVKVMHPRWHFTRAWASGVRGGKSLQTADVDKFEDIYFMHYAVPGDKVDWIEGDFKTYGYLGYDEEPPESNVNAGVIVLSTDQLQNTIQDKRLDVEDNVGENIHIHYRNLRFDFTIRDFIELAKACEQGLTRLYE